LEFIEFYISSSAVEVVGENGHNYCLHNQAVSKAINLKHHIILK